MNAAGDGVARVLYDEPGGCADQDAGQRIRSACQPVAAGAKHGQETCMVGGEMERRCGCNVGGGDGGARGQRRQHRLQRQQWPRVFEYHRRCPPESRPRRCTLCELERNAKMGDILKVDLQPQAMARQPRDAGKNERKAGL